MSQCVTVVYVVTAAKTDCEPAKCNTVYGLHFGRGGSSGGRYHANGYWVGENYPEITIQALQSRFERMNHVDQHAFRRQVQNLPDTFEKVFCNAFQQNFSLPARISPETPATDRLAAVEKAGVKHVSVRDITAISSLFMRRCLQRVKRHWIPPARHTRT